MAKSKQSFFPTKWFVILLVLAVLLGVVLFVKGSAKLRQTESTSYRLYNNLEYGFNLEYPENWVIRNDTQAFENGDIVSFNTTGKNQKPRTELTDGARLSIAMPFTINTDLISWLQDNHKKGAKFSQMTFTGVTFEQVDECYIGCPTYFYTLKDDKVFGIATLAAGDDSYKMVYDNALVTMLKSFKFTQPDNQLSEADAISKVKAQKEVKEYLKRVPNALVAVNGEEDTTYMVQVYEIKDGHTATFNWYSVNKQTGEISKEF